MRRAPFAVATVGIVFIVAGCLARPTPTPLPSPSPSSEPTPTVEVSTSPTSEPSETEVASPTATPEPSLSLDLPEGSDQRVVSVTVEPNVGPDGGEIIVSVTSAADERIDELVLRWPTELNTTLVLAPFVPSEERIRDGGPPLVQEWTKWVVGPGEQGEPDGTISLGYGPLLPGATLTIPLNVRRTAEGAVAFDLQVLAGNDQLTLDGGEPAELRVEVP
jgi:hypothetical protein